MQLFLTTLDTRSKAEELVSILVEERLAACGTIFPGATSVFIWDGKLSKEEEVVVLFKVAEKGLLQFRERLVQLHPYDIPEILSWNPSSVHSPYLEWVEKSFAPDLPASA